MMVNLISWLHFCFIKVVIGLGIDGRVGLVIGEVVLIRKKIAIGFIWITFMEGNNESSKVLDY